MRKVTTIILGILATATSANAQVLLMEGSDTLEFIMQDLIDQCPSLGYDGVNANGTDENDGSLEIDYVGGGSSRGEDAIERDSGERTSSGARHQLGPMSRAMDAAACTPPATNPLPGGFPFVNPHQYHIGDDDILALGGNCDADTACPGSLVCKNYICTPAAEPTPAGCDLYGMHDVGDGTPDTWGQNMRILYFGISEPYNVTNPISSSAAPVAADCNSQARRDLVASCNLYHIYRRDDASGTTGDFKRLLNVPVQQPFCNNPGVNAPGSGAAEASLNDKEDRDPVRVACNNGEDVCQCDGTLGLLLPMLVPAVADAFPASVLYPSTSCTAAGFQFGEKTTLNLDAKRPSWHGVKADDATVGLCSDGSQKLVGGCVYGVSATGSSACMYHNYDRGGPTLASLLRGAATSNTVNLGQLPTGMGAGTETIAQAFTRRGCFTSDATNDVRSLNLDVRSGNVGSSVILTGGAASGSDVTDWAGRAYYRIHSFSPYTPADGYDFANTASVMIPNPGPKDGTVGCSSAGDPDCAAAQPECQALDATVQIGCLTNRDARWGKRSLGFAGLQAGLPAASGGGGGNGLRVDGINSAEAGYPFSRKLYVNLLRNDADVKDDVYGGASGGAGEGDEASLLACIKNESALLDSIVNANGFRSVGGAQLTPTCGN